MFEISCLYKKIFKIECPTCGITRAIKNILQANIGDAIKNNPMVFLLPLLVIANLLKLKKIDTKLDSLLNFIILGIPIIWLIWYIFLSNRLFWR